MNLYYVLTAFVFGLIIGSFANVCIWRIPEGISIVKPRSFCPECKRKIPWYYNIPVLSYIFLKGKCAFCKNPIHIRYPVVELLTGIVTASWFIKFELPQAFVFVVFGLILIIISGIDFKHFIIPQPLAYFLMAAGVLSSSINPYMENIYANRILYSIFCLIAGGSIILLIRILGNAAFKKEAMGLGDVKLMMGIGAFTGFSGIFWTLFIASIFGSIVGVTMILRGAKGRLEYIPFGPYLATGAILYIHFSELINKVWTLYL